MRMPWKKEKPKQLTVVPVMFYGGAEDGATSIQTRVWIHRIVKNDRQGRYCVRRSVWPGRYHHYKTLEPIDAETVDVIRLYFSATEVIRHETA